MERCDASRRARKGKVDCGGARSLGSRQAGCGYYYCDEHDNSYKQNDTPGIMRDVAIVRSR